jgi:hypothetical protein
MQELLFGTWSPQLLAYGRQYPWRVFAALLVGVLVLDLMFGKGRSRGDSAVGGWDFGDGDGDGCGD